MTSTPAKRAGKKLSNESGPQFQRFSWCIESRGKGFKNKNFGILSHPSEKKRGGLLPSSSYLTSGILGLATKLDPLWRWRRAAGHGSVQHFDRLPGEIGASQMLKLVVSIKRSILVGSVWDQKWLYIKHAFALNAPEACISRLLGVLPASTLSISWRRATKKSVKFMVPRHLKSCFPGEIWLRVPLFFI